MDGLKSNRMEAQTEDDAPVSLMIDGVSFASRLKEARAARNLTQQQVAEHCGISNRTVSAWENGIAEGMLASHLFCVADYLGVDARWLATGDMHPRTSLAEILNGLEQLSAEQQEAVRALVKSLTP